MKKPYEVTYKVGQNTVTKTVKAYTLIGVTYIIAAYDSCENVTCIKGISFKRYHALNTASAIREADGGTFEAVLIEAAKKLNVEI